MLVWQSLEEWQKFQVPQNVCLTLGNFDGVHLGHQELLKKVVDFARAHQGFSLLYTFQPHPVQILAPEKKHTRLFSLEDQQKQLAHAGLQGIFRQPFSREFSEISAEDFLSGQILKYFHPRQIVIGHDFSFGAHRRGTHDMLRSFCQKHQIQFEVVPARELHGEIISTSHIREHLTKGEVAIAEEMLGRKYYLQGVVEKGEGRGRQLGFATANIRPDIDFYPRMGVYVCQSTVGEKKYLSVMNIGINRTFVEGDHHPIKAEVHLLDYSGDLYGRTMKVELVSYLRPEKKFASLDELKTQIAADIQTARGTKI